MEHRTIKNLLLVAAVFCLLALTSCYNDNYTTLYPSGACNTTNVTFTVSVLPVINTNCSGCHGGSFPAGNITLTNYSDIVASVNSGRFMGAIRQDPGYSAMPKGGNKLSDCDLAKITIWVNQGKPDN